MWGWLRTRRGSRPSEVDRERDLEEEFQSHLELREADLGRAGFSPDEARRRARLEFGGAERYKEQVRTTRDPHEWLRQIAREYRVALRRLRAAPLYATFSIVTLALGIGITTAVYSVVYLVAGRSKVDGHQRECGRRAGARGRRGRQRELLPDPGNRCRARPAADA